MENVEELRQAIASLQWENQKLRTEAQQAGQLLKGLEALHRSGVGDDPFDSVFDSLGVVFDFSQAMVLTETDNGSLSCVVAEPIRLVGARWPVGAFFAKVMDGNVSSVFSHAHIAEWEDADFLSLSVEQPGLYLPLNVHDRRGVLILLRPPGAECFNRDDVALARRFSVLASLALAALTARQLIDRNRDRARAAEEANHAKTMFLANMSHELRTPLNAIIGFSELMEQGVLGPLGVSAYGSYIGDIRRSGQHLLAIINNLLLASCIEAGQHETKVAPVNLSEELEVVARLFLFDTKQRDIEVTVDAVPAGLVLDTDPLAIRQILINIVGNAVKFSEPNSRVTIRVEPEDVHTGVRLSIADTGCGIPPYLLRELGKPFTQAEGPFVRRHQGTGLGLAICFQLAGSIGAEISIDSEPGQGTTVGIEFPNSGRILPLRRAAADRA